MNGSTTKLTSIVHGSSGPATWELKTIRSSSNTSKTAESGWWNPTKILRNCRHTQLLWARRSVPSRFLQATGERTIEFSDKSPLARAFRRLGDQRRLHGDPPETRLGSSRRRHARP